MAFGQAKEITIPAPPIEDERTLIERCRRARKDDRLAVLEGLHALKHAIRFDAAIDEAYTDDLDALIGLAEALAPDIVPTLETLVRPLSKDLFCSLAPRPPETGVLTFAIRPSVNVEAISRAPFRTPAIWLEDPAHLGNVGAVIRVAAAAGASAVLTSGRHDPWDPAALRAAAGLHFALPVLSMDEPPRNSGPLIAIDPAGDPFRPDALPAEAILAFGSERRGLSSEILDLADQRLSLPMRPNVSSLNLATAVSAVLYAWRFASSAYQKELGGD